MTLNLSFYIIIEALRLHLDKGLGVNSHFLIISPQPKGFDNNNKVIGLRIFKDMILKNEDLVNISII
jgi:hypothetical protein